MIFSLRKRVFSSRIDKNLQNYENENVWIMDCVVEFSC
jgi:hypothetical protein